MPKFRGDHAQPPIVKRSGRLGEKQSWTGFADGRISIWKIESDDLARLLHSLPLFKIVAVLVLRPFLFFHALQGRPQAEPREFEVFRESILRKRINITERLELKGWGQGLSLFQQFFQGRHGNRISRMEGQVKALAEIRGSCLLQLELRRRGGGGFFFALPGGDLLRRGGFSDADIAAAVHRDNLLAIRGEVR